MKNSLTGKKPELAISCALALGFGSGAAISQDDPAQRGSMYASAQTTTGTRAIVIA